MTKPVYALAILAHPDDESFLLAGTTFKLEEEGKDVAVICVTRGEHGVDRLNRHLPPEEMGKIRTHELESACKILHCECKFFDLPDGSLDQADADKLIFQLIDEINAYQPEIIITFGDEGISGHKDHISIGQAALAASKQSEHRPRQVWRAVIPTSMIKNFNEHMRKQRVHHLHYKYVDLNGVPDEQIMKIDIEKYRERKIAALEAHQSQYVPHLTWPGFLLRECFEVVDLA